MSGPASLRVPGPTSRHPAPPPARAPPRPGPAPPGRVGGMEVAPAPRRVCEAPSTCLSGARGLSGSQEVVRPRVPEAHTEGGAPAPRGFPGTV